MHSCLPALAVVTEGMYGMNQQMGFLSLNISLSFHLSNFTKKKKKKSESGYWVISFKANLKSTFLAV